MKNTINLGLCSLTAGLLLAAHAAAQISLTATTPYSQNFDGMTTNIPGSSATPAGWFVGGVSTTNQAVSGTSVLNDTGALNNGSNYNYGVAGVNPVTDRALGTLSSNAASNRVNEVRFTNNTGLSITNLNVSYDGEQWRDGGAAGTTNGLVLLFSSDGINFTPMGSSFNFTAPQDGSVGTALDGNAATNRVAGIGGNFATNIANGTTVYLRWFDNNDSGADDGLAVDNFSLTVSVATAPTNSANFWISSPSGKWEVSGNWSAGTPNITQPIVHIANAATKTITIDATTVLSNGVNGCMTISNLAISAAGGSTNTFFLNNAGTTTPLREFYDLTLNSNVAVVVNNSAILLTNFAGQVVVGNVGGNTTLAITNGGAVFNSSGFVGFGTDSSNCVAFVGDPGSIWSNSADLIIGNFGSGNQLIVTNGGAVFDDFGEMGSIGGMSNVVVVTGNGSVWNNRTILRIGTSGSGNQLIVTNGGAVFNRIGYLGQGWSNSVRVVDNATWQSSATLYVGYRASSNTLTIAGGSVIASNAVIGISDVDAIPSNNVIRVDSGSLFVTNALGNGSLVVSHDGGNGGLLLNGGSVTVDSLIATNGVNSVVTINGGTLTARSAIVSNGQNFVIGDTGSNATYVALGGTHAFNNDIAVGHDFAVGNVASDNRMVVSNAASVLSRLAYMGSNTTSSGNSVLVTGSGSTWATVLEVHVGQFGPSNSLVVSNQGLVADFTGILGAGASSSNNSVLVTGTGSVWSNQASFQLGNQGAGNSLVIDDQGEVLVGFGDSHVAAGSVSSSNNSVLVTGTGSLWRTDSNLKFGELGAGNSLVISNQGVVLNKVGHVGFNTPSSNNTVRVADGAVWQNDVLNVGNLGSSNLLVVAGGSVLATNLTVGLASTVCNNLLQLDSGSVIVTNAAGTAVFEVRRGTCLLNGGTLIIDKLVTTNACAHFMQTGGTFVTTGSAQVDQGTQMVVGGTTVISSNFVIGSFSGASGTVIRAGGALLVTNGVIGVGNNGTTTGGGGVGLLTISNSDVIANAVLLGSSGGGQGSMAVKTGGRLLQASETCPPGKVCKLASNDVLLDGGTIEFANAALVIGENHQSTVTISNGVAMFGTASVGFNNTGSLTMPGGSMTVLSNMLVGDCGASVTGVVTISGGSLYVTNATGTAVLEIRDRSVTLSAGLLKVDKFVMTNACASFLHTGGALVYGSAVLDPNRDDDGDGIPNGYEQSHGLDPLNGADANLDSDGDGLSNLQEFQAGTDATNSASALRITSIVRTNNDLAITWMTGPDRTNALERTAGIAGTYATNAFAPVFSVTNTSGTATNYVDHGAATNVPSFYYRVRLVP